MMGKVTFKNYYLVFPSISNFCETFPDKLHVRDDCIPLFIDFSVEVLIFDQFIKIDYFPSPSFFQESAYRGFSSTRGACKSYEHERKMGFIAVILMPAHQDRLLLIAPKNLNLINSLIIHSLLFSTVTIPRKPSTVR